MNPQCNTTGSPCNQTQPDPRLVVWDLSFDTDDVRQVVVTATDNKGRTDTFTHVVKVDLRDPSAVATVSPSTPPDGTNGWYRTISSFTVQLTGTDPAGGSELDRIQYTLDGVAGVHRPGDPPIPVTGDGDHLLAYQPVDRAGRRGVSGSVRLMIDTTPPAISITSPQPNQDIVLGTAATADYSCSDQTSGINSCTGTVPDGAGLDTSSVGQKTFTVNAQDNAGNTASAAHTYRVIYNFDGFFHPVDTGALNVVGAGRGIPVRFTLGGDQGLDILATSYPQSKRIECDGTATSDPVEETVTAGQSGLMYAGASDTYTYLWKTEREWAGTCRRLTVRLDDGTDHTADFRFTRP